jgi:diguanylate cyclase (GGDEF)-like protein
VTPQSREIKLDFNTLLWLQLISAPLSSAVLLSAQRALLDLQEAVGAVTCLIPAYAFLLLRDTVPAPLSILGANLCFWVSSVLVLRGMELYVGRPRPSRWPLLLIAVATAALTAMVALGGPYGLRALFSSLVLCIPTCAACIELIREEGLTRDPARKLTVALLGLAATGLFARAVVLLPHWSLAARPPSTDLQIALAHLPGMLVAQGFGLAFLVMHSQRLAARATEAAATDGLTGCANRRALEAQVRIELAHAARQARPTALLVLDLDHFKRLNDAYGHATGDAVLVEAARIFRACVRPGDLVARYGGEEFCVLLREANLDSAQVAAERLCQALRTLHFEVQGVAVPVRASCGVAASETGGAESWESLFRRADAALYRAKLEGRDRVVADR